MIWAIDKIIREDDEEPSKPILKPISFAFCEMKKSYFDRLTLEQIKYIPERKDLNLTLAATFFLSDNIR